MRSTLHPDEPYFTYSNYLLFYSCLTSLYTRYPEFSNKQIPYSGTLLMSFFDDIKKQK